MAVSSQFLLRSNCVCVTVYLLHVCVGHHSLLHHVQRGLQELRGHAPQLPDAADGGIGGHWRAAGAVGRAGPTQVVQDHLRVNDQLLPQHRVRQELHARHHHELPEVQHQVPQLVAVLSGVNGARWDGASPLTQGLPPPVALSTLRDCRKHHQF